MLASNAGVCSRCDASLIWLWRNVRAGCRLWPQVVQMHEWRCSCPVWLSSPNHVCRGNLQMLKQETDFLERQKVDGGFAPTRTHDDQDTTEWQFLQTAASLGLKVFTGVSSLEVMSAWAHIVASRPASPC